MPSLDSYAAVKTRHWNFFVAHVTTQPLHSILNLDHTGSNCNCNNNASKEYWSNKIYTSWNERISCYRPNHSLGRGKTIIITSVYIQVPLQEKSNLSLCRSSVDQYKAYLSHPGLNLNDFLIGQNLYNLDFNLYAYWSVAGM